MSILLSLLLGLILAWFWRQWTVGRKFRDLPGPAWYLKLPLIGHSYMLGKNPTRSILKLTKKYGGLFRMDIGSFPTVVIASYDLMAEAFKREDFNGRIWNEIDTFRAMMAKHQKTGN